MPKGELQKASLTTLFRPHRIVTFQFPERRVDSLLCNIYKASITAISSARYLVPWIVGPEWEKSSPLDIKESVPDACFRTLSW
jgi:hypothetical protein